MTISIQLAAVANAIAAISVTNVAIKDIDEIPADPALLCPIMFPDPKAYFSDLSFSRVTFGSGGTARMDLSYTLNYVFLHSPVGSGIAPFSHYADVMTKLLAILAAIFTNDVVTGAVDVTLQGTPEIGPVQAPSGAQYWGALFSLRVLEQIQ